MAREGANLDAVVAFHAGLPTGPVPARKIKAAVLVINGSDDAWLDPKVVASFKKEMAAATKDFKYLTLAGARHSFTNKQANVFSKKFKIDNLRYNKQADRRAWDVMQVLFKRVFSK